jgi:hypothetical protein
MFAHELQIKLPFKRSLTLSIGRFLTWDYFNFTCKISREIEVGLEVVGFFLSLEIKKKPF